MFGRAFFGLLLVLGFAAASFADGEQPVVKRFAAGAITLLQTQDGRFWSPLIDNSGSSSQASESRYFGTVAAKPAASGDTLVVATLYVPQDASSGARSFEETFEVQCDARQALRTSSTGFSGEYLTGSRVDASAPELTASESASLISQACTARDFAIENSSSDQHP